MCLFYFGGFPRNPVYRPIVCQLSGGERVNRLIFNCFGTKLVHIRYKPEKVGLQYTEVDDDPC